MRSTIAFSWPRASARSRKSISSSGKSSVASTSVRSLTSASLTRSISRENAPCNERLAERAAASVLESIRSLTASACARSSLSLRNARSVNSPGSATRNPRSRGSPVRGSVSRATSRQRASSSCSTTGPPCACSSSTSSPVYECGDWKVDRQALIDRLAARVGKDQVRRAPRHQCLAADRVDQRAQVAPRRTHDADGGTPRRGGDGNDRIMVARQHAADSGVRAASACRPRAPGRRPGEMARGEASVRRQRPVRATLPSRQHASESMLTGLPRIDRLARQRMSAGPAFAVSASAGVVLSQRAVDGPMVVARRRRGNAQIGGSAGA